MRSRSRGEPAEKEADAVGDHVADELHGGGEKHDSEHAKAGKEQAPAIGAKLQPGAISLAKKGDKKDDKKEEPQKPRLGTPGQRQVPPKTLPAFPQARRVEPRTPVQGGGGKLQARWEDSEFIYEFDYQHGTVEKFNKRGVHVGEFDPNTGAQTKPADKSRRIDS
jgi:hypothetical protein